jgi:hypothetical protein
MISKYVKYIIAVGCCISIIACAGEKQFIQENPQEGKCLLVGAVLLENNGLEGKYETKFSKITVIIVGKYSENGEEKTQGYRVKTDENGYFILQNVPEGSYVIKGFEADIGYETRLVITSRWDGNLQVYHSTGTMIDYTVRVWPEPYTSRIIDLEINYFMVDQAMRVANEKFKRLQDKPGSFPGSVYTMKNPVEYYRQKYPQWEWFQMQ